MLEDKIREHVSDERLHSPSDGIKACFVSAPDRRLGAMLGSSFFGVHQIFHHGLFLVVVE